MTHRFFLRSTTERPQSSRVTPRGISLREDRDGHLSLVGPVRVERDPLSFRLRLAIGFTLTVAIGLVMLSGSYGEKLGPAVDGSGEEP